MYRTKFIEVLFINSHKIIVRIIILKRERAGIVAELEHRDEMFAVRQG